MKKIHLVCNAHIDPVWLWNWEEGLAETLSTFRIAAEFCEKRDGFVFCHNEALLYQWVEEYEPALFRKIRKLVSQGKWHIIGGWYLQPDCNIPSGESFARQILAGKSYFRSRFGIEPATAANFDPFGHSRGLVQILKKSGYHSYLFCRPGSSHLELPSDFIWKGFDGSELLAHRSGEHYNSEHGKAAKELQDWIEKNQDIDTGIFLWGIGNHGGGPSREDLRNLGLIQQEYQESGTEIIHSWPEAYFEEMQAGIASLPVIESDLNPWAVGCYTSMARVKKMHRQLEDQLFLSEKMSAHASISGLMKYPSAALSEAQEDLLFCEFHDILPGSGIPEVEELALQKLGHGMEILSRIRARAFYSMLAGQKKPAKGEFPVLVYNHEPYEVNTILRVELQAPEPNFNPDLFWMPELFDEEGNPVILQLEKESANIANDHRKRIVFRATLKASSMNRFSCFLKEIDPANKPMVNTGGDLHFDNGDCEIGINPETGLIHRYRVNGVDYLKPDGCELLVMQDTADPWGMKVNSFRDLAGRFRLMNPSETAGFAGTGGPIQPVRIIEEGPVRVVVEALLRYNRSDAVVHYCIPRTGSELQIGIRVFWNEKDRFLKLAFPTQMRDYMCMGQVAGGIQEFSREGEELVAHKWVGLFDEVGHKSLTIANQTTYGFDISDGDVRLSLLRSPAYAGHPVDKVTPIVRQDRFTPRMDQGEHHYTFLLNAGDPATRLISVDLESRLLNTPPFSLCCYPSKHSSKPSSGIILSNPAVRLDAFKLSETGKDWVIRLFNTTPGPQVCSVGLEVLDIAGKFVFNPMEVKTLKIGLAGGNLKETELIL
jgi:alpha-mannosidase